MNDSDMHPPTDNDATPAAEAPTQPDAPVVAAPKASTSLDRELAESKDRLLRTLADMDNMRKRTEREVADARVYGISAFARDILSVADNMHRAMAALDDELRAKADESLKALLDGVELTERALINVLEKHGVGKLEPLNQKFDPNRHQAMFEVEDAGVPSGTVVQVMQAGYTIGERVLRPALVAVSKGGAKSPSGGSPPAAASANDNPSQ